MKKRNVGIVMMAVGAITIGQAIAQENPKEQAKTQTKEEVKADMLYVEPRTNTLVWTGDVTLSLDGKKSDTPYQNRVPKAGYEFWEITFRLNFAAPPLTFKKSDLQLVGEKDTNFSPFDCYEQNGPLVVYNVGDDMKLKQSPKVLCAKYELPAGTIDKLTFRFGEQVIGPMKTLREPLKGRDKYKDMNEGATR